MKKCIMSFLLVMAIFAASAQVYLGGGMNFSFINNDGLDLVVDEYNDSRSYLTQPMAHVSMMRGGHVTFGFIGDKGFTYDLSWTGRHQTVAAEGIDATNVLVRREVKVRNNSFDVGMGWTFPNGIIRPGLMGFLGFGNIRTFTRSGPATVVDNEDFIDFDRDLMINLTIAPQLFIRFGRRAPLGLLVRPYYQVQLLDGNFEDLDAAINPGTFSYLNDYTAKNSHFGVQTSVILVFGDKESKKSKTSKKETPPPAPSRGDMKRGGGGR